MKLLEVEEKSIYKKDRDISIACTMISLLFLTVFVVLILHYRQIGSWSMDNCVYNFFQGLRSAAMDSIFVAITHMGNTISITIWTAIVFIILFKNKYYEDAFYFAVVVFCSYLLNDTVKLLIRRPRPVHEWLVHATNYSFPSGHAMVFMSFSILLIYFMFRFLNHKKSVWIASVLLFILAILVGLSRVYVGVHYISDVLGGWSFSAFWIFANLSVLYRLRSRRIMN